MALFDENEPPSNNTENIKDHKLSHKNQNHIFKKIAVLAKIINNYFFHRKNSYKETLANFFVRTKMFSVKGKYMPHLAIISLALVIAMTNLGQKMAARAYGDEIITIDPDMKTAVAGSIDQYTLLINQDAVVTEKAADAIAYSDGFISSNNSVLTEYTQREEPLPDNSSQTVGYTVKEGDTLTGLGWKFDVKIASLKYVNDIGNEDLIKPGMTIKVPKKGYEVPQNLIAKKEKEKQTKLAAANRNTVTRNSSTTRTQLTYPSGSKQNGYPYGYCTYYVATKRFVPSSWGNAKSWLSSASRAGYSTGSSPTVGSIVVTSESFLGHVAYVENVEGNQITITEMNAKGWGVTSRRTISAFGGVVRGYIY